MNLHLGTTDYVVSAACNRRVSHCTGISRSVAALFVAVIGLTCTSSALAVLGQPLAAGSVTSPGTTARSTGMSAKAAVTSSSGYTVSKTVMESGTVLTEFATPAGIVFALSWEGPFMPDLSSLLGAYFATFKTQADATRTQRNIGTPVGVDTGSLVVRSSGRMRNFSGYAYAPDLIPSGVSIGNVLP